MKHAIISLAIFLVLHSPSFSQEIIDSFPENKKASLPDYDYSQKRDNEIWEEKLKLSYTYENYYQNLDSAISLIRNISINSDTDCFRNFRIGTLYYSMGDYKNARKYLLTTYPCMANSTDIYQRILDCEMKSNLLSKAEETATGIYNWHDSLNYSATLTLAWLAMVDLDFYQAKEFIERYLKYFPDDLAANQYYSECLNAQRKKILLQKYKEKTALLTPAEHEQKNSSSGIENKHITDVSKTWRINGYGSYVLDESKLQGPSFTAEIYNYQIADYFSVMNLGFNADNRREGFRNSFGYFFKSGYSITSNQGYFIVTEKFTGPAVKKEFLTVDAGIGTYNKLWNYSISAMIINDKKTSGLRQEQFNFMSQFFKDRRVELKLYVSIIKDELIKKDGYSGEMNLRFRITPYTTFEFQYYKGTMLYPYTFSDGGVLILTPQILESNYGIKIEQTIDTRWQIFGKYSKAAIGTTSGTGVYGGVKYRVKKF